LVLAAFRRPDALTALGLAEWDLLIRQARAANLLASLHASLDRLGLLDRVPSQPREHLEWSSQLAERQCLEVEREVDRIRLALAGTGVPVILLKGAAYVKAGLPHAKGRLFSDVDILVPKSRLGAVEASLMLHGWASMHQDPYDQRYYRTWMHELPPMQHIKRLSVIDVHHTILPETAPYHPDPEKLLAAARQVTGYADLKVLSPTDMVLHSAVHLMHEGEFHNGLRDLVDLDSLLRHFGVLPSFWPSLVARAVELELTRPLFYVLRYTTAMLDTPVPATVMEVARTAMPNRMLLMLMDRLFMRALLPVHASCNDWMTGPARQMLYVRSNWLRMPPLLLARHLFRKALLTTKTE
jgi:hypothetical protein